MSKKNEIISKLTVKILNRGTKPIAAILEDQISSLINENEGLKCAMNELVWEILSTTDEVNFSIKRLANKLKDSYGVGKDICGNCQCEIKKNGCGCNPHDA